MKKVFILSFWEEIDFNSDKSQGYFKHNRYRSKDGWDKGENSARAWVEWGQSSKKWRWLISKKIWQFFFVAPLTLFLLQVVLDSAKVLSEQEIICCTPSYLPNKAQYKRCLTISFFHQWTTHLLQLCNFALRSQITLPYCVFTWQDLNATKERDDKMSTMIDWVEMMVKRNE